MDVAKLKEKIIEESKIPEILSSLGCEYVKDRGKYYSSSRPNGDNKQAVVVYKDGLNSECYTAAIKGDLITLVEEFKGLSFPRAMKWICDTCGWDYYDNVLEEDNEDKISDWEWINKLLQKSNTEEQPIKPLPNNILLQYIDLPHEILLKEGIDIQTQKEWEVKFSLKDERIIYVIRDEIGSLVGIKGRATKDDEENKYIYHYPVSKSRLLFGLHKSFEYIKEKNEVYIMEAEKSTIKAWSYGYKNTVAIGGKSMSEYQALMLARLGVECTLCLDKDVKKEEIEKIYDLLKKYYVPVNLVWDKENILLDKESPIDIKEKWEFLINYNKFKLGGD